MAAEHDQQFLEHLREMLDAAGALPVGERVRLLEVMLCRVQAAQSSALRELADSAELAESGCRTVASWVRLHLRRAGSSRRAARRALVFTQMPEFATAFTAGEIGEEHVDTVVSAGTNGCGWEALREHETTLVQLARDASAAELGQAVEALADLARPDRDAAKVTALADRFVRVVAVGDLVHVDAMVGPDLGETLKTAVEAGAVLPVGLSRADDGRTLNQRRADAFGMIVTAGVGALATGAEGRAGVDGGSGAAGAGADRLGVASGRLRPQVAVTVSLDTLAGLPDAPRPLLAHFGMVPTATVRRLVCDGDLIRVVLGSATGLPLDVGRASRLATRRQRRALAAVFRTCVFPGCTVPYRFCEVHHRDWWSRGGCTDLAVLLPYCWTHHHFLHEYGFTVDVDLDSGRLVHRRPDGGAIPDPDHLLATAMDQLSLRIEANHPLASPDGQRRPRQIPRPPPDD